MAMTVDQIMRDSKLTVEQKIEAIGLLTDERVKAASASSGTFSIKVGEKGGLVIRGIRGINSRMGLAMYVEAWEDLDAKRGEIATFVKANNSKLSRKDRTAKAA